MNDSNPPPLPPQPATVVRKRKSLGCLSIGCLLVVAVLLLIGAGVGGVSWLFYQGGQAYVSEQAASVRIVDATDAQYQTVLTKLAPFSQAVNEGRAATLEIAPEDLNILIARSPQFESWRGRLFLTADQDQIIADVSAPLTDNENGRGYISGRTTLDASYSGNGFVVYIRHLEPLDHAQARTRFTRFLNNAAVLNAFGQQMSASLNDGFHDQAAKDPATADFLRSLRTIVIQNGKIVVTTNERPGGLTGGTPTPTPVATGDDQT